MNIHRKIAKLMLTILSVLAGGICNAAELSFSLKYPAAQGAPFIKAETSDSSGVIEEVYVRYEESARQWFILSRADLKGCMELVVTGDLDYQKLPSYTPFLWHSALAYSWSGICRKGFRSGAGSLQIIDTDSGEYVVETGSYFDGQRRGLWTYYVGQEKRSGTFGISDVPQNVKLAAEFLASSLKPPRAIQELQANARELFQKSTAVPQMSSRSQASPIKVQLVKAVSNNGWSAGPSAF